MGSKYGSYRDYLASIDWANLRDAKLAATPRCERCGENRLIQVHHLRYRQPWENGEVGDLETLCRLCHELRHGKGTGVHKRHVMRVYLRSNKKHAHKLKRLSPSKRHKALRRIEKREINKHRHNLDKWGNFILPGVKASRGSWPQASSLPAGEAGRPETNMRTNNRSAFTGSAGEDGPTGNLGPLTGGTPAALSLQTGC